MDARPSRGRGGGWKRGGRGGSDGDSFGGEHRGRGRGGPHRGRAKRDHHRGRGRGGGAHVAEFRHRDEDEGESVRGEDGRTEVFSRRKLESNWDRYEESERQGEEEDGTPTQRGTDYQVLLDSAGDSFTQFRFSEEKDWEMNSFAPSQLSAVFVDLAALAQRLQEVPLHLRLDLEAELLQISTPVELPAATLAPKQEEATLGGPPPAASKGLRDAHTSPPAAPRAPSGAAEPPVDDDGDDEELEQLLSLQKAEGGASGNQPISIPESGGPEGVREEVNAVAPEETEEKDTDATPPGGAPVRQEVTEEDLEDWLDSMIS